MRKKKNSILRRIIATASALVMAATLVAPTSTVAAATTGIDTTQDVTLTITKYQGTDVNTGSTGNLTGTTADEPSAGTVLADVEFTVVKVADISQTSTDGSVSIVYTLTNAGINLLFSSESGSLTAGTSTKTADVLQTALTTAISAGSLDSVTWSDYVTAVSGTTDASGQVVFSSTSGSAHELTEGQGVYLVVETAAPATVTTKAVPVLVSLPMAYASTTGGAVDSWLYNVYTYPKNSTSETDIDKEVTEIDGVAVSNSSDNAEASVGSVITYSVPVTAVVPADGLTKLGITDTMSAGLTFNEASVAVTDENGDELTVDIDYTVDTETNSDGSTIVKIYFTNSYLATLNAGSDKTPEFTFTYTATLNKNAVAGTEGTGNSATLIYNYSNNTSGDIESGTGTAKVYSWGIKVTKTNENGTALSGVNFVLSTSTDTTNALSFAADSDGVYTLSSASGSSTTLTTDTNGNITIKGLKSGTYYLIETSTNSGYTLVDTPIKIVITGNDEDGTATATVDDNTVTMASDGSSTNALVPITVVNSKSFNLPQTGAAGTAMFAIIGVLFVAAAGALVMLKKKRA